ncbi:MAG: SpoIID/LytB domain-containing protein [Planctomycetota bacterium]|nr:SpoIID/LytB domain-containing protein [Planctomycetota bacterium]
MLREVVKLTLLLLLVVGCRCSDNHAFVQLPPPIAAPQGTPLVRVLLKRTSDAVSVECLWRALIKLDEKKGKTAKIVPLEPFTKLLLRLSGENLYIENLGETASEVTLETEMDGMLVLDGKRYRGRFFISVFEKTICVVNILNLECYVASVIGGEMGDRFKPAALCAQAVAARTYALWRIQSGASKKWHITAGPEAQVYGGADIESDATREATSATMGFVLTYEGRIFPAFYSSTCGGWTSSAEFVFGGKYEPPLKGGVECLYCDISPHFKWSVSVSEEELLQVARSLGAEPTSVKEVIPKESDPVGRFKFLEIITNIGILRIGTDKFRALIGRNRIRSTMFSVTKGEENKFLFSGKGWGHGVGMCQWGAEKMARLGFSTEEILKFYYPSAEITRNY